MEEVIGKKIRKKEKKKKKGVRVRVEEKKRGGKKEKVVQNLSLCLPEVPSVRDLLPTSPFAIRKTHF